MKVKINLGCGPVYLTDSEWVNLDYAELGPGVQKADLLGHLPFDDGVADLVYSSHFLEHVPLEKVPELLSECIRVLRPGGILRLVLPDLEELCREYLHCRALGEHEKADFVVVEMIDQCVRSVPGGELGAIYRTLQRGDHLETKSMIAYVRERNGEILQPPSSGKQRLGLGTQEEGLHESSAVGLETLPERARRQLARLARLPAHLPKRLRGWVEETRIRLGVRCLPPAFRAQNLSLASVGERHHWVWDFHQLETALKRAGFIRIERRTASTSAMPDFSFHPLDLDHQGRPRKGFESMYIEACKPG